ncbi:MAG: hypothetical protein ACO3IT_05155 [Ilumatobacteraceae bacterium]|jgi:hypothetical protein
MMQIIKRTLLLTAAVVLGACGSGSTGAEIDEAPDTGDDRSLCERVFDGEIIQAPDGQFEVCQFETSYGQLDTYSATGSEQDASFVLSGFGVGETQGANSVNHPSSGASDGKKLVIADRFNNRVLVFNTLPTTTASPDLVLGQPNFTDTTPGTSLADMNWPGAVEITPDGKLLVADTENGRILVYRSIPTQSGASADYVLDLEKLTGEADAWPWGVWSDDMSLVVTDTRKGNILVWDTFPVDENAKPNSKTNPDGVGTPRNISSDGKSFLIGDENGSQSTCWGEEPQNKMRQSHIWVNRLPIGNPDGCVWDWYQGDAYKGGLIAVAAGGRDAHYWPVFPVDAATANARVSTGSTTVQSAPTNPEQAPMNPDQAPMLQPVEPGQQLPPLDPNSGMLPPIDSNAPEQTPANGVQPISPSATQKGHSYLGGDGGDVVVTDTAIYFVEYNGNRVTGWNSLPTDLTEKVPDFSVFESDGEISSLLRDGLIQNPVLVKAGTSLVATSDYDRRMHVWTSFPGQNSAKANYVYLTGFPAWDNSFANNTLVIAGQRSVAVWNNFVAGALPDQIFSETIGSVAMSDLRGVAYDGTYLALADRESVSVFEGIPATGQQPFRQYAIRGPGRLDMRNGLLAIAPREGADVYLVDVTTSTAPQKLNVKVNLPMQAKFLETGFAIADTSFHRVQIWSDLTSVQAGTEPHRILGGAIGDRPQTLGNRFYFPSSIEEVNGTIFVGEFKFSNRILVFAR